MEQAGSWLRGMVGGRTRSNRPYQPVSTEEMTPFTQSVSTASNGQPQAAEAGLYPDINTVPLTDVNNTSVETSFASSASDVLVSLEDPPSLKQPPSLGNHLPLSYYQANTDRRVGIDTREQQPIGYPPVPNLQPTTAYQPPFKSLQPPQTATQPSMMRFATPMIQSQRTLPAMSRERQAEAVWRSIPTDLQMMLLQANTSQPNQAPLQQPIIFGKPSAVSTPRTVTGPPQAFGQQPFASGQPAVLTNLQPQPVITSPQQPFSGQPIVQVPKPMPQTGYEIPPGGVVPPPGGFALEAT
ncbi:uncharacterized protein [Watersipora subatra]|uniref:uncharacterized protein n=1 Tax=Watersipora subatra TaxID=2589382 RepID=UPI00355B4FDE